MATLSNRPGCHLGGSRDKMGFSPLAMSAPGRVEHNQHARLRFHEAVKGGDEICSITMQAFDLLPVKIVVSKMNHLYQKQRRVEEMSSNLRKLKYFNKIG